MSKTMAPLAVLAAAYVVPIGACKSENVTEVGVTSVEVVPPTMNAVEGERHQLSATVVDDRGQQLTGAPVEWSSQDPTVAVVDASGTVEARSAGTVEIRAAFREAWGSADVRVLPNRALAVSRDSVGMVTGLGRSAPPPEVVHVTNAGVGELDGVSVNVRYPEGTNEKWLDAELASGTAPTTLTLTADPNRLALGVHRATAVLAADDAADSPVEIAVTLRVRLIAASTDGTAAARRMGRWRHVGWGGDGT